MRDNKFSKNRKLINGSAVRSSKIVLFFIAFLIIICQFSLVVDAEFSIDIKEFSVGKFYVEYNDPYQYEVTSFDGSNLKCHTFSFANYNDSNLRQYNGRCQLIMSRSSFVLYVTEGNESNLRDLTIDSIYDSDNDVYYYSIVTYSYGKTVKYSGNSWTPNGNYQYYQTGFDSCYSQMITYFDENYPSQSDINWGNPADVNISTVYSGNVQNSPSNIDKFTWNNNVDSNGISYITHLMEHPIIEVQAVPITWKTSTRQEMENQTGADATVGTGVVLDSYNARTGHLEITWQEVINYLQIEYADIYSYFFDGQYWISRGWFYRIRLVADGYQGEWITLSNGLNLSPTKGKKLIEDPYDETIYNILKEISENNNQTTTVYEYGDTNITINNDPSSGWQDPDGGGSFWDFLATVIKAISDGIASIVSSVASLVGDIIDGVLGLFTFDNFTINNYDTEVQTIKENSGIFGQSIEFADSINDSIRGVQQQPAVLHFDGIVIDNVQLIPAVDLDFDQMVVDAGLTEFHNLVYVFTDGTILISLIIMVHHKVMEVLRK